MLSPTGTKRYIKKMPHFRFTWDMKHAILNGLDQNRIKTMDSESR
jgi:hypothetical protein